MSIAFALLYNVPKFFEFATCNHENDILILPLQMSLPYQTEELMINEKMNYDSPILSNDSNPYPIKLPTQINDIVSKIYSNKQNSEFHFYKFTNFGHLSVFQHPQNTLILVNQISFQSISGKRTFLAY